ncbi:hypothetical protein Tco_0767483 [Tanacetum coccineum]
MAKHRAEVVCYEKYIRVPYGNDMLIIQGERSGVKNESRLEVISSIRMQKYIDQGYQVFLIQIMKEEETEIPESDVRRQPLCGYWRDVVRRDGDMLTFSAEMIVKDLLTMRKSIEASVVIIGGWAARVVRPLEVCCSHGLGVTSLGSLSTLHFLKASENRFEVLKVLENSLEVLKVLENNLESLKLKEN